MFGRGTGDCFLRKRIVGRALPIVCPKIEVSWVMTTHMEFLIRQSRSADTIVASAADNCRFDERASEQRWQRFDATLSDRNRRTRG